jgi:hypothetical protein
LRTGVNSDAFQQKRIGKGLLQCNVSKCHALKYVSGRRCAPSVLRTHNGFLKAARSFF